MRFSLSNAPEVRYSPLEQELFEAICKLNKPTTDELVAAAGKQKAFYGRQAVVSAVSALIAKSKRNKEKWQIKKIKQPQTRMLRFEIVKN